MKFIEKHRNKLNKVAESVTAEVVKTANQQSELSPMQKRLQARKAKAVEQKEVETLLDENKSSDQLTNELDSKVEDAKDELAADLENQTGEISEELGSLKDDVGHLESRVDEHDDDIQALKSQFDDVESAGNPELETHKAIIEACIKEMSSIEDIEDRLPFKAEACKRLEAFVTGYMQSGAKYPNCVAVWFMIWLFDLGDIAKAVPLALHLSAQKVHKMPSRFNGDIECFICDQVYDWASAQLETHKSAGPYLDDVVKAFEAAKWKLPALVEGKMYVMRGKHLEVLAEDKAALTDFEKAMSINSRAGVKKKIEKLKTKLALE